MPIHQFDFNAPGPANLQNMTPTPRLKSDAVGVPEIRPLITMPRGIPDNGKRTDILFENLNVNTPEDVREILPHGFYTMDRGIKNYFSGIRIPTQDGMRMMGVRISGGDKTILVWKQDLKGGRVTLPVMSINRESAEFNVEKFTPAYGPVQKEFVDSDGSRIREIFRPQPYLIDYSLTIWAEHKRDAEYATYQINTRFHPLAEFVIEDEYIRGNVIMKMNGWTDNSDKEADSETRANVRYDISVNMEGWLPLPTKIVPSVLGNVGVIGENASTVYARS